MTNHQPTERQRVGETLRRFVDVPVRLQTYRNLAYLALAFPLGLMYFVGVTIGLSLGAGLLITWVGLPIIILTVAGATVVAGFEAQLARHLLQMEVSLPEALRGVDVDESITAPRDGFLASLKRFLLSPTTWTSVLLVALKFVFGITAFVALVTASSVAFGLLSAPVFYNAPHTTYRFGTYTVDTLPEALFTCVVGVLLTLSALHLLNALARLGGILTSALLSVAEDPA